MGKGGGKEQTSKVEPWGPTVAGRESLIGSAGSRFSAGGFDPNVYTGRRVPTFSGATQEGLRGLPGAVRLGDKRPQRRMNDAYAGARGVFDDMTSMDQTYRDFDRIKGTVADDVLANTAGLFSGGGLESGLAQDTMGRAMGDALAQVEYGAYNDAQQRRLQAMGFAPELAGLGGMATLYGEQARRRQAQDSLVAGGMRDQRRQAVLQGRMDQNREANAAQGAGLERYADILNMAQGGGRSQTGPNPNYVNPVGGALGGAATGIGTYGALLGSGVGAPLAIGGGILAGLGSLF